MTYKLNENETILPDNYPIFNNHAYIIDGTVKKSTVSGTVKDLKLVLKAKEIRRLEIFGHEKVKIGDRIV